MSNPTQYHIGKFPPTNLDREKLEFPIKNAHIALARYDESLKSMENSQLFLSPLIKQEAVLSSRIEGTKIKLSEVLQIEADADDKSFNEIQRNESKGGSELSQSVD